MKKRLIATLIALLAGCATGYGPTGAAGGYEHTRLAPNVFRVTFKGNGATSPEAARDMALLRSAELSLAYGYRYFVIVDGRSSVATQEMLFPGAATTSTNAYASGNRISATSTTTYAPSQSVVIAKPTSNNTVVASKERPDVNGMVYDAQFIWDELSVKYKVQRGPAL